MFLYIIINNLCWKKQWEIAMKRINVSSQFVSFFPIEYCLNIIIIVKIKNIWKMRNLESYLDSPSKYMIESYKYWIFSIFFCWYCLSWFLKETFSLIYLAVLCMRRYIYMLNENESLKERDMSLCLDEAIFFLSPM